MEIEEIEDATSVIKIGSSSKCIMAPTNSKDNRIESAEVSDEMHQNLKFIDEFVWSVHKKKCTKIVMKEKI